MKIPSVPVPALMRKTLSILSLFLCLVSCKQNAKSNQNEFENDAVRALREDLEVSNRQLPMTMSFFTLEKMEIKGGDYLTYATIYEDRMDFDEYVANIKKNRSNLFSLAAGNNPNFARLFVESGLDFKFIVTGKPSNRKEVIVVSAEELQMSQESGDNYSAKDFMLDLIEEMKSEVPSDWGDGLSLTDVYAEGNYMCYKVHTDESVITMALLRMSESADLVDGAIEEWNETTDPEELLFVRYLVKSGMGVKYIYWSRGHSDEITVTITPAMIKNGITNRNLL